MSAEQFDLAEAIEAAARAMVAHHNDDWDNPNTHGLGDIEKYRDDYRALAQTALTAAMPSLAIELRGPTVLNVERGERLMFIVNGVLTMRHAHEMLQRLSNFLPGIAVAVCDNTAQVIREADTAADAAISTTE